MDHVVTIPVQQDWAVRTGTPPESKVQPCEWKQYGYWTRPSLNSVECPNSREYLLSLIDIPTNADQPSTVREASVPKTSKISSSAWEVPNRTINTQNYGFLASNTLASHLVLLVGQSPYQVNPSHFLGKFKSTPCCSTWFGVLRHYHGTSEPILTIAFPMAVPDSKSLVLRQIELNQPLGLSSRICVSMLWLRIVLPSFHGPLQCVIRVDWSVVISCREYIRSFINL